MQKKGNQNEIINVLVENSVILQKVMTDVSINLKKLNEQLATLLGLFENAAKGFVEKEKAEGKIDSTQGNELINKLDTLLEQNRTIAKGLTLLEQKVREQGIQETEPEFKPKPLPEFRF